MQRLTSARKCRSRAGHRALAEAIPRANLVCILFRQSCSRLGEIASAATEDDRTSAILYNAAMTEKAKPDLDAVLHRTLNNACRKWEAREIRLRYLP
jgi:hypothetical protein